MANLQPAVEKILRSLNIQFEIGTSINPSAHIVYIRPRGVKITVLQSALDDNPVECVLAILAEQPDEWWLGEDEFVIGSSLELRRK